MKNKMTYKEYYNKVKGGWYGKCLGGTIGCFEGTKEITDLNIMDLLPDKMIANDDLDIQLIWIDVLLNKGIHFTSEQLMQAWLEEYDYNFGEYSTGRRNYLRGLKPPISGKYSNVFFLKSMGCPIRSEIWGLIAPGNPDLGAKYAYKDAILDHEGESVWAEQFLAAIEAAAFFEEKLMTLIEVGINYLPPDSLVYQCVMTAIAGFKQGLTWQQTWKELRDQYGHPDCTYCPQNMGIIVMALLHGAKDFDKTLTITANAAWDVDCTCSTVAALLGILIGYENFDKKWLEYVGEEVVTLARPQNDLSTISLITEYTCRAGVTCIKEQMNNVVIIEEIPDGFPYLAATCYQAEVAIDIDYCGNPVIAYNQTKEIVLQLKNNTDNMVEAELFFTQIPTGFVLSKQFAKISLCAKQTINVPVSIWVQADVLLLADKNIMTVSLKKGEEAINTFEFGLCGAPTALISELFYDTYSDWLHVVDMPKERLLNSNGQTVIIPKDPEEWGNHRIDIHKEYLCENFSNRETTREKFAGCKRVGIVEDIYALKDTYGFQGSACVYYYQEVYSQTERTVDMFTGSSDPFKLWLNGELKQQQEECRFWYPYQHVTRIHLNKGINYIVIKIARKGAENRLSMAFRHEQVLVGFDSAAYITDLSYSILN